ncbi:hypothetical protein LAZ67_8001816, partial [Cordylochernes scorpioides]
MKKPSFRFLLFFFLISTQSYQGIKLVELVDGVCAGDESLLLSYLHSIISGSAIQDSKSLLNPRTSKCHARMREKIVSITSSSNSLMESVLKCRRNRGVTWLRPPPGMCHLWFSHDDILSLVSGCLGREVNDKRFVDIPIYL